MKKIPPIVLCIFIAVIWLSIVVMSYYLKIKNINDIISYITGWTSLGLFILTIFYVVFTNSQIKELEKQRMLQVQPFINIECIYCILQSPKICWSPGESVISIANDIDFRINIKNIGNGSAILLDIHGFLFEHNKKPINDDMHYYRIIKLEINESKETTIGLRYFSNIILNMLSKMEENECPRAGYVDLRFGIDLYYKNISGQSFKIHNECLLSYSKEVQKKVDTWIVANKNFTVQFRDELEKYRILCERNDKESDVVFGEIRRMYHEKCSPCIEKIDLLPIAEKTSLDVIEMKEYKKLQDQIKHGFPIIGKGEKFKDEFEKDRLKYLERY